jgi:hypothetical protein
MAHQPQSKVRTWVSRRIPPNPSESVEIPFDTSWSLIGATEILPKQISELSVTFSRVCRVQNH